MSTAAQSGGRIDVELPSHWEDEIKDEIHDVTQRVDSNFREAGFENDLETVRILDTGEKPGAYLQRENDRDQVPYADKSINQNRNNTALIDLATNYDESKSQEIIYIHELGHEFFRNTALDTEEKESQALDEADGEKIVLKTLNEAFADLTGLSYNNEGFDTKQRNPFKDRYEGAFQGLEKAFNIENRENELKLLKEIREDVKNKEYDAAWEKAEEIQKYVPDVKYTFGECMTKDYNIFLAEMEEFFMTEKDGTAQNEEKIRWFTRNLTEKPKENVLDHTVGCYSHDETERKQKARELCEDIKDEGEVQEKAESILKECVYDRLEPTIEKVEEQIESIDSIDIGQYALEKARFGNYTSSNPSVNQDMDFPHEVGGVLAEVLHSEYNVNPTDVAEDPLEYAEVVEDSIKETIRYGVDLTSPDNDKSWEDADLDEFRDRLSGIIGDYNIT